MTRQALIHVLTEIGLREPEARVYLAALSCGPTTVLTLAQETSLKRTTIYSIVEELQRRGLMSIEMSGFKKRFVAAEPSRIEQILVQQREKLQRVLPELDALANFTGNEQSLKYYAGLEAVKGVYEQLIQEIRPYEDYLILSDLERWLKQDPEYFLKFIQRRAKLSINIRMLTQDSAIAREHQRIQRTFNEAIQILPKGTQLTTNLVITPQRVVIHQIIPPIFAIVIENKSIIQMHREQFEMMWRAVETSKLSPQ